MKRVFLFSFIPLKFNYLEGKKIEIVLFFWVKLTKSAGNQINISSNNRIFVVQEHFCIKYWCQHLQLSCRKKIKKRSLSVTVCCSDDGVAAAYNHRGVRAARSWLMGCCLAPSGWSKPPPPACCPTQVKPNIKRWLQAFCVVVLALGGSARRCFHNTMRKWLQLNVIALKDDSKSFVAGDRVSAVSFWLGL